MGEISVHHNGQSISLALNDYGNVALSYLNERVSEAASLAYKDDKGQIHALTVSLGEIILVPGIKEYDVHFGTVNGEVDEAFASKPEQTDGQASDGQEEEAEGAKEAEVERRGRGKRARAEGSKTVRVGWLHRGPGERRFRRMGKPLGRVARLKLDGARSYEAGAVRRLARDALGLTGEPGFAARLGLWGGRPLERFELPGAGGQPCDLWSYCDALGTSPYQLDLFLLTEPLPDQVRVLYRLERVSKYSGEMSCTECAREQLHASLLEEQAGQGPELAEFEPLEHGYAVSRIDSRGLVLLRIEPADEGDAGTRRFDFPGLGDQPLDQHRILHEIDGYAEGKYGLGVIPSCTDRCRPVFSWYRDGQLFRQTEFLYWLAAVRDRQPRVWTCRVECATINAQLTSKDFHVKGWDCD